MVYLHVSLSAANNEYILPQMVENTPVGRFGELEEIANLSAYLVSDYSNFMNGSVRLGSILKKYKFEVVSLLMKANGP